MNVNEKLLKVREHMNLYNLDALIVPSEDPHGSEYPANHWKFREYLSGFNGSAGVLVITQKYVGLWTDSRYYIQAEKQLRDTCIEIHRLGTPGVPDHITYLTYLLPSESVVGVDGFTISMCEYRRLKSELGRFGIKVNYKINLIDELFVCREDLPLNEIVEVPDDFVVESRREKFEAVRLEMAEKQVTHYLVSALDDIAWLLNLRGSDVNFNPVFYAYMIITQNEVHLYIDPHKLTADIYKKLERDGVTVSLYDHYEKNLSNLPVTSRVYYNPRRANARNIMALPQGVTKVEDNQTIIERRKACKTENERQMMHQSHLRDGVAMVKFMHWLDCQINAGAMPTEMSLSQTLHDFRAEQKNYLGESFETIVAVADNAAIVHYTPKIETNRTVEGNKFLLIDSGAHYNDGTTDITRTIAVGSEEEWQKEEHSIERSDYTLVLKGHINLARAVFPQGTTGIQLDTLARVFLWKSGKDYGHGTGHGIGFNLNVHEGPQSISKTYNGIPIQPGMVVSNEPGLYREGKYGIRIENLIVCEMASRVEEFGQFLRFQTLTLCPFERKAIDVDLLTDQEIAWINNYHRTVYDKLSEHLTADEARWLRVATRPIEREAAE